MLLMNLKGYHPFIIVWSYPIQSHIHSAANILDFTKPEIKLEITKLREILLESVEMTSQRQQQSHTVGRFSGKLDACKDCVIGKAKQRKINKRWSQGIKTPGEKQYIDITLIKGRGFGGPKLWTLIVDN